MIPAPIVLPHLPRLLNVRLDLVADEDEREGLRRRARHPRELVAPPADPPERVEGAAVPHVEDEDHARGVAEEGEGERLEALLTGGVPHLEIEHLFTPGLLDTRLERSRRHRRVGPLLCRPAHHIVTGGGGGGGAAALAAARSRDKLVFLRLAGAEGFDQRRLADAHVAQHDDAVARLLFDDVVLRRQVVVHFLKHLLRLGDGIRAQEGLDPHDRRHRAELRLDHRQVACPRRLVPSHPPALVVGQRLRAVRIREREANEKVRPARRRRRAQAVAVATAAAVMAAGGRRTSRSPTSRAT